MKGVLWHFFARSMYMGPTLASGAFENLVAY
jgi:hypothetical protein